MNQDKVNLFTEAELDYLICAIIKQQTEFENRLPVMQRFATAEHLANHVAKIEIGDRLLKELQAGELPLRCSDRHKRRGGT